MSLEALLDSSHAAASPQLRNEPVQARSTARLAALLDAAAAVVDEIGYERLTTAMVADNAGASIGTVYRYFPDRIAVLQALGARNLERVLQRATDEIVDVRHSNWAEALGAAFGILVDAFRHERGFRSLRVGDVIDLRPPAGTRTYNSIVAESLHAGLVSRFDVSNTAEAQFAFETAIEVSDSLASRAFALDADGDQAFLDASRDIVFSMLVKHFGAPTNAA